MLKDLEEHYGQKVFSGKAYDVMLSLDLDKYVAWRRVVLPEHLTFLQLHEVIQCAFSWGNYHLFRFELKDRNGQPIIIEHFFDEIDALHREDGTLIAEETLLSEYLDFNKEINYTYDFGDEWEHIIKIESVVNNNDKPYAVCTGGENDGSPEDVGGVYGFVQYHNAVNNPKDPGHNEMKE